MQLPPVPPANGEDDELATGFVYKMASSYAATGQPLPPFARALMAMALELLANELGEEGAVTLLRDLADEREGLDPGSPGLTRQ